MAVDDGDLIPHPMLDADVRVLIGMLAVIEGMVTVGSVPRVVVNKLSERFVRVGILQSEPTEAEFLRVVSELNMRLRRARGEQGG